MSNQSNPRIRKTKRGSSRRKGDEYQDLTSLRLILDLYIAGKDFEAYLEYEFARTIDDVVLITDQAVRAIQVKYAIDPLAVYTPEDLTDEESPIYFGKF